MKLQEMMTMLLSTMMIADVEEVSTVTARVMTAQMKKLREIDPAADDVPVLVALGFAGTLSKVFWIQRLGPAGTMA